MKKMASVVVLLLLTFALCACGAGADNKNLIENCKWKMQIVKNNDMSSVQDDKLSVLAVGAKDDLYPNATVVELILTAKFGKISIKDETNDKEYEGTYLKQKYTPDGTIYEVVIDGKNGYATVSTTKSNGIETQTMPINLGDCSIYFYPAE